MRNSFPGICYRCKKEVKRREGHFEIIPKVQRTKGTKWRLQHAECAIHHRMMKEQERENKLKLKETYTI